MRSFDTQEEFETYWFGKAPATKPAGFRATDQAFLVWFSATWCGPCKRLDMEKVEAAAKEAGLPLWKVEQTVNSYTAGYCDIRSLPTFALMIPKKIVGTLCSSDTDAVVSWIGSTAVAVTATNKEQ
jgi:thiol-disulfide isomerase/thioredoxin